jgi:UDP-N-acetylmuramoyl-L-alanyl-D-glutamate--2,6-diaminopimelate ligase
MKKLVKNILGKNISKIRPFYHGFRSILGDIYYQRPSQALTLIAITGTKGKTSTTILTGRILNYLGLKTGYLSTGTICLDGNIKNEFINPHKNTTLDSFLLHKFLSVIKTNGCKFAVLEMSSIGLEQYRHLGLKKFDSAALLNMFPEHLEHHGGWENYKKAKAIILKKLKNKGNFSCVDDANQQEVKQYFTTIAKQKKAKISLLKEGVEYEIITSQNSSKLSFNWENENFETDFIAPFQIKNLIFSLDLAKNYVSLEKIKSKLPLILKKLGEIPGRMEFVIKENQEVFPPGTQALSTATIFNKISVLVDYAHEPESLKQLLETLVKLKKNLEYTHIIHILSCDGAGRDDWKKSKMGKISASLVDYLILTTDNYDENDNPKEIIKLLKQEIPKDFLEKKVKSVLNRKESFIKALEIAKNIKSSKSNMQNQTLPAKVLIVSTGVGTEQKLTQPYKSIIWDERKVWIDVFRSSF